MRMFEWENVKPCDRPTHINMLLNKYPKNYRDKFVREWEEICMKLNKEREVELDEKYINYYCIKLRQQRSV